MGEKSHVDTSWLIALFNPDDSHHAQARRELEELTSPPSISSLALAELLVAFDISDAVSVPAALQQIQKSFTPILSLSTEIAARAAELRSNHKVTLAEAIVISSALHERSQLLTFDKSMKAIYERIK